MPSDFADGMAEATRLTRAGRLAEAAALIQRVLNGGGAPASGPSTGPAPAPATIDAEYVVVADEAARQPDKPTHGPRREAASDADPEAAPPYRMPGAGLGAGLGGGLGETIRRLRAKGFPGSTPGACRPAAEPIPDGASFRTHSFSCAAGQRDYKLYIPAARPAGPVPLIVMLHGCTQNPDDFAAGTGMNRQAEEHGVLVAYPAQPQSANAQRCWNWFSPDDQRRDGGEAAILAGMTRQIIRDHGVDPARVHIAGLSAGGAFAAIMAVAYPDLFASVGIHSGLPAGAARDLPSAFAAMRQGAAGRGRAGVPAIIFHGDGDTTVHPRNGDALADQFTSPAARAKPTVDTGRTPGGRTYRRAIRQDRTGRVQCEVWTIQGAGHAWSGGSPSGSYTDPQGPDASREMLRFFKENPRQSRHGG